MSEDDSWSLQTLLGIPASIVTLLMGADWLWNKSAAITWIASAVWSGLFISVKFWHLITIGILIAGGRYGLSYLDTNDDTLPYTAEDIQDINDSVEQKPDWKEYKYDIIKGVKWKWDLDSSMLENDIRPVPYCPECDMKLKIINSTDEITRSSSAETKCMKDDCDFEKKWDRNARELSDYVKNEIKRRKRTEEWKEHI